jgi:hypothetical protein
MNNEQTVLAALYAVASATTMGAEEEAEAIQEAFREIMALIPVEHNEGEY